MSEGGSYPTPESPVVPDSAIDDLRDALWRVRTHELNIDGSPCWCPDENEPVFHVYSCTNARRALAAASTSDVPVLPEPDLDIIDTLQQGGGSPVVTRFEVVDHRTEHDGRVVGRIFVAWPCSINLLYQDNGRTLKVIVNWPKDAK